MQCYIDFAKIYDSLICDDIDYEGIADFVQECFKKTGKKPQLMLDLACGTGTLTDILAKRGYDMIGADLSADMLSVAREKNPDILYLCQDMRKFELYGTVDAVLCMTDSLNYITDYNDLCTVFRLVKNYLNPNAPFIFDMNSHYKLSEIISDNTFTFDNDDVYYIWENEYDKDERTADFYLTFFVQDESGSYTRFDENHTQKAYTQDEVINALKNSGFSDINVYDGYSFSGADEKSERLVYIAR